MPLLFLFLALSAALAAQTEYRAPAGTRFVDRSESSAILPSGRLVTPLGQTYVTGPGSFGIAISPSGKRVITADGGPNRFALSLLDTDKAAMRYLMPNYRGRPEAEKDEDDEWKSVFQGLAFLDEQRLFASEGNSGAVRLIQLDTGKRLGRIDLNTDGFKDSYSGDIVLDLQRKRLYIVDQANFRLVIANTDTLKVIDSVPVGRLPFAIALSPDRQRVYVTNFGLFRYEALPGADTNKPETGVYKPVFGFPSRASERGTTALTANGKEIEVPGLGEPNVKEANSLAVIDVSGERAEVLEMVKTGKLIGGATVGGSSPSGVIATADRIYVSNAHNDSITVLDAKNFKRLAEIEIRIPGLEKYRGVLPIGLALDEQEQRLYVAEAGINALGVIDTATNSVLGHLPTAWFPTRVALRSRRLFVACAKGMGTGPNDPATLQQASTFQGSLRRGRLNVIPLPDRDELIQGTTRVLDNNGFIAVGKSSPELPEIRHVVIIVKENRTYDEIFGALPNGKGEAELARLGTDREITLADGKKAKGVVMPNHLALARRFAISDNFYADSEVSVDGHHWLVGSYPNAFTESSLMAAYGGQKDFKLSTAPGRLLYPGSNSSVHPEEILEAGTLWHHLDRNKVRFRNYGEGFELAGGYEGEGAMPTGERLFTNMAIPEPLYRNTHFGYAQYNTNIPDQYRVEQFLADIRTRFETGKERFPQLIFIHLPNDHMAGARPKDGYPHAFSYAADNDIALGKIVSYLSKSPWWKNMAILVTEDDSQGGVDHVDSHRTAFLAISPYSKRGYVSHQHSNFSGMLKTAFRMLGMPPLNLYDAVATDLSDCFTSEPDLTPYELLPVNPAIFNPALAKDGKDAKPGPRLDDPVYLELQHEQEVKRRRKKN